MTGKLYIVATPIGNLADITFRAIETLKSADLIACEDTRVSQKLLTHYNIKAKLVSYHQHSGAAKVDFILQCLADGKNIAVITDAGTPGISDPGNQLVARVAATRPEAKIEAIPGPSALTAALGVSGLPTDKFLFLGFLPHKKGKETLLKRIVDSAETVIFYESTHRILKTLAALAEMMPRGAKEKNIVVCRELTKKFETIYRGKIVTVIDKLKADTNKGEFVVIVGGK